MTSHHETLHTKSLVWTGTLPDSFTGIRLPGSTLISAQDVFGSVTIQEYNTADFSILFTVADLNTPFSFITKTETTGWLLRVLIKGNQVNYKSAELHWTLQKNQLAVLQSVSFNITSNFSNPGHYSDISFFLPPSVIEEILPLFPQLQEQIHAVKKKNNILITEPVWSEIELLDTIQSILTCPYEKQLRQYFYEARIKDMLFHLMVQLSNTNTFEKQLSQKELEAIILAEQIITKDITAHFRIPELAKKITLNENRFKVAFKKVFGIGPYEYLVLLRMKKAVLWLQEGKSVKETAALTGYRPSDFTVAFINHYGFTPSSVKRNKT